MPVQTPKRGAESRHGTALFVAISAHEVIARSLLAVGSMQKSRGVPAALPEPQSSGHVGNALAGLPDFCFQILSASFLTLAWRRTHARAEIAADGPSGDTPTARERRRNKIRQPARRAIRSGSA
jgi:hypothetical protein